MKRLALLALLLAPSVEAAIAFRSIGAGASSDGGTSITPGTPAGVVSTDIVVAVIGFGQGTGVTITPPSGWTLINRTDSTTIYGSASYWALGSVGSYVFSVSGLTSSIASIAAAYSGVDNVTPMDVTAAGQTNGASTTVAAPSITTVTANTQLVLPDITYDALNGTVASWTAVFGTFRGSTGIRGSIDTVGVSIFDGTQAATGATGAKNETQSRSVNSNGVLAALRPGGGAAAVAPKRTLMGVGQ